LYAAVVMPDHVHLILTPLLDLDRNEIYPLHKIMRGIKSFSARKINANFGTQPIWQEESFDHVLRSSESLDAKIAYVFASPVRHGLAILPGDYPWGWRRPAENPYSPSRPVQL
jgi:putative transposase